MLCISFCFYLFWHVATLYIWANTNSQNNVCYKYKDQLPIIIQQGLQLIFKSKHLDISNFTYTATGVSSHFTNLRQTATYEMPHDKTNKMIFAPSEDSGKPGHPSSHCTQWVAEVPLYKRQYSIWATSWQNQQNELCAQWRLRSAWASARSDLSLRCALNG